MVPALAAATQLLSLYGMGSEPAEVRSFATAPTFAFERAYLGNRYTAFAHGIGSKSLDPASTEAALRAFKSLPKNWDAQGAQAPNEASIDAALLFLGVSESKIPWEATLHADGRAILEAEGDGWYFELTFGPGGSVVVFSRSVGGKTEARTMRLEEFLQTAPRAAA